MQEKLLLVKVDEATFLLLGALSGDGVGGLAESGRLLRHEDGVLLEAAQLGIVLGSRPFVEVVPQTGEELEQLHFCVLSATSRLNDVEEDVLDHSHVHCVDRPVDFLAVHDPVVINREQKRFKRTPGVQLWLHCVFANRVLQEHQDELWSVPRV